MLLQMQGRATGERTVAYAHGSLYLLPWPLWKCKGRSCRAADKRYIRGRIEDAHSRIYKLMLADSRSRVELAVSLDDSSTVRKT
jgi:hypothetical protein